MTTMLTKAQYADEVGASVKSVERWLSAGLLPAASRQGGRWYIPSGTPRPDPDAATGATSRDVAPLAVQGVVEQVLDATPDVGVGGSLDEFAQALGFSRNGVRRLYADMLANPGLPMYVGRYGPTTALRVYVPPR